MSSAELLPDRVPKYQQLALWRRACSAHANVFPLTRDWAFRGPIRTWSFGGVVLAHQHVSATRYERTQAHIDRHGDGLLVLWYVLRGSHALVIDGQISHQWDTRNIGILDSAAPYVSVGCDCELVTVGLPRHQLPAAEIMGRQAPVVSWCVETAPGKLLSAFLDKLLTQLPDLTAESASALGAGLVGMVNGLLCAAGEMQCRPAPGQSRAAAMKRFITVNLRDPGLGVRMLYEHFHCSRATVYRLFEDEGGVASYIQRQRLNACMRELSRIQDPPKGVLEQVASAWGFTNPHRFSRLFKAQFDLTAQEVLRARAQTPDSHAAGKDDWENARRFRQWLVSGHAP